MRQHNHVLALSPTGGAILPGEIAEKKLWPVSKSRVPDAEFHSRGAVVSVRRWNLPRPTARPAYRSDDPGCGRSSEPTSIAQFPDLPLSHAASGRSYAQAAQLHPQIPA